MIKMTQKGSFRNAERFFDNSKDLSRRLRTAFERYGAEGVEALRSATPRPLAMTSAHGAYRARPRHRTGSTSPAGVLPATERT